MRPLWGAISCALLTVPLVTETLEALKSVTATVVLSDTTKAPLTVEGSGSGVSATWGRRES